MHKGKDVKSFLSYCAAFLFGAAVGSIFTKNCFHCDSFDKLFWDVKFIEIVQVVSPLVLATIAIYYIRKRLNIEKARILFLYSRLKEFQDKLSDIFANGKKYIANPNKELEQKIIIDFHQCGCILSSYFDVKGNDHINKNDDKLEELFFTLKKAMTDSPFGEKLPRFRPQQVKEIDIAYHKIISLLYRAQSNIYGSSGK